MSTRSDARLVSLRPFECVASFVAEFRYPGHKRTGTIAGCAVACKSFEPEKLEAFSFQAQPNPEIGIEKNRARTNGLDCHELYVVEVEKERRDVLSTLSK